jgi:apolipoprotein N-acyltransferase
MTDRSPGKELTIFHAGPVRFGVQICFENMFPEQIRTLALRGVDFVVGQTNEAYTDSLAGHYQNLVYYVFRAIENRLPVIRSATTGISCIIDATGRIIASVQDASGSEVNVAGVATAQIALGGERSFYTRHGDLFAYVCIAVVTFLIAIAIFIRFRRALMPNH